MEIAAGVLLQHVRLLEEAECVEEEVVEVEGRGGLEGGVIARVGAGHHLVAVAPDGGSHLLGNNHLALSIRYLRKDAPGGVPARIDMEFFEHALHESDLVGVVVNDEVGREPNSGAIDAQPASAHAVEGAHVEVLRIFAQEAGGTFAHLAGGLVGEGDGQDAPRRHAPFTDQVGDALRDDPGLAAAGPGEDKDCAVTMGDGGALGLVQAFEEGCQLGGGIHEGSLPFAHPPYPFHGRPYGRRKLVWASGSRADMGELHV